MKFFWFEILGVSSFQIVSALIIRGGSRTSTTSKMGLFMIIVNDWKPLTSIPKCSILDVAAVLDPPLILLSYLYEVLGIFFSMGIRFEHALFLT